MISATPRRGKRKSVDPGAVSLIPIVELKPAPENRSVYRPVRVDDPDIIELANDIKRRGVLQPLLVSTDGFIISGHRRHVAARQAGLTKIPCRIADVSHEGNPNEFLRMLTACNLQREKTNEEVLRELVSRVDASEAHEALRRFRWQKSDMSVFCDLPTIAVNKTKARKQVSGSKMPFLEAAKAIIEDRKEWWPLSVRQVHYALLNDPPLRNSRRPESAYRNDQRSYHDLCDILARARIAGLVSWESIADDTRPMILAELFPSVRPFVHLELERSFRGYRRDLLQGQLVHIEILAEKLTVRSVVERVAGRYGIPVTIGRGYAGVQPRWELVRRWRASGKERLKLLIVSDHDPDGETIAASFAASLVNDFGVHPRRLEAHKVAITIEQVRERKLPPGGFPKFGCSTRSAFVAKYGEQVYELEALRPEDLSDVLDRAVRSVIDWPAFAAQEKKEAADAATLEGIRRKMVSSIQDTFPAGKR